MKDYIDAIEQRLRWLHWVQTKAYAEFRDTRTAQALDMYQKVLEAGDTFFMNARFCELVDHARLTIPDELAFDAAWMQSKQGFMFLETPFLIPKVVGQPPGSPTHIQAVGWFRAADHPNAYEFLCFHDLREIGAKHDSFNTWSYFGLEPSVKVIDKIRVFEKSAAVDKGAYAAVRESDMLHEIRWAYVALYLMAQRLATTVQQSDRSLRRRLEKQPTIPPMVRLVTLRRYEEQRAKAERAGQINWQWQWAVRGHWRNQWFPKTQEHRPVFIESYVKGPANKPLKPPQHQLFIARR